MIDINVVSPTAATEMPLTLAASVPSAAAAAEAMRPDCTSAISVLMSMYEFPFDPPTPVCTFGSWMSTVELAW